MGIFSLPSPGGGRPVGSWSPWARRVFYQSFPGELGPSWGCWATGQAQTGLSQALPTPPCWVPGTSCFPCLEFPSCPSGFSSLMPLGSGRIVGSGRIGGPDSDGHGAGRAVRAQGTHLWARAPSPLGPCRQSLPHGAEVCLLPSRDPTNFCGEDPGRRVECGQAARGHPGVKLSVPQLHGEQGAAGRQVWGRRGPWGHQPSIPTRPCWQRARLTTLPFSPLTLGAAPPSPPASQGGGGGQRPAARTPALCTSCRVDPPRDARPWQSVPTGGHSRRSVRGRKTVSHLDPPSSPG